MWIKTNWNIKIELGGLVAIQVFEIGLVEK